MLYVGTVTRADVLRVTAVVPDRLACQGHLVHESCDPPAGRSDAGRKDQRRDLQLRHASQGKAHEIRSDARQDNPAFSAGFMYTILVPGSGDLSIHSCHFLKEKGFAFALNRQGK